MNSMSGLWFSARDRVVPTIKPVEDREWENHDTNALGFRKLGTKERRRRRSLY